MYPVRKKLTYPPKIVINAAYFLIETPVARFLPLTMVSGTDDRLLEILLTGKPGLILLRLQFVQGDRLGR